MDESDRGGAVPPSLHQILQNTDVGSPPSNDGDGGNSDVGSV